MTDKEYIEQLVNKLNKASDDYYNGHESMSDHEFDELLAELERKERETGIVLPNSPTQNVGADSIIGEKIEHEYKMLSLPKSKSIADAQKYALQNGRDVIISWKLDGNSVQCTWDHGRLQRIETRGNGSIGTVITRLQPAIKGIPLHIPYKRKMVVRGEALINLSDFEELKELNSDYMNSRNLCAGSLNLKDVNEVKKRRIHWTVYTLAYISSDDNPTDDDPRMTSWEQRAIFMKNQGLDVVGHKFVKFADIPNAIEKFSNNVSMLDFPVDGLVEVGTEWKPLSSDKETGKFYKNHGWAIKWQDECKETYVKDIVWNVNQNCITPVAIFIPVVELEGTKVERATLNNIDFCRRIKIGRRARIVVHKANKIIPQVVSVTQIGDELEIPTTCPVCGSPTKIVESESGAHTLVCTNPHCIAKSQKIFEKFVSRDALDIRGISGAAINTFIGKHWLKEYADFYHLKDHLLEISSISGYGAKSAKKMIDSIEKSRHTTGERIIYGLSIPLVGKDVAKKVLSVYSFSDLMDMLLSGTARISDFSKIDGIGDEKSSALIKWFNNADNNLAVRHLLAELDVEEPVKSTGGDKCAGLTFCITGGVHSFKNRDEFKAYVESQGGKVSGSVSKKLTALVNNDAQSTSSKNRKAHELGVLIITEDEFIVRYGR